MTEFFSFLTYDFGLYGFIGGACLALLTGLLGCFMLWKRMVFYGDALAHTAFLAVAIALLSSLPILLMILVICLVSSIFLSISDRLSVLPIESWLGAISYGALACGLLFLSLNPNPKIDAQSILFGDLLAISLQDCMILIGGVVVVFGVVYMRWKDWILITISKDLAHSQGIHVSLNNFIFLIFLSMTVALGLKIVGALLVPALLILPASIARLWSRSAFQMVCVSCLIGLVSVIFGLGAAFQINTQPSATIILINVVLLILSVIVIGLKKLNWRQKILR